MQEGAARLRISLDAQSASLRDAVEADFESMWIEAGRPDEAVLRVQITRGSGGRGYAVSGAETPTRVSTLHPWPWMDSDGTAIEPPAARLRFCQQPLAAQPVLAGIKHSNRLEQILARMEWGVGADAAFDEGLMSDAEGRIIEGTMSNVFVLHQGTLHTAALDRCGIAGVMRSVIIDLAERLAIPLRISTLNRVFVEQASCIFLCNSLAGIWPVHSLEGQTLKPSAADTSLLSQLQTMRKEVCQQETNNERFA
jgi:4-amino-4-deoxychorismate lyase